LAAYVIAGNHVVDDETMREYAKLVPATLEPFGGRFVVRGGQFDVVEGAWTTPRLVVIEFPSPDHARGWYHSDAYQAIIQMRFDAARTDFFMFVDGVA
jgi:uncharacterized protein (DUF1330 family)